MAATGPCSSKSVPTDVHADPLAIGDAVHVHDQIGVEKQPLVDRESAPHAVGDVRNSEQPLHRCHRFALDEIDDQPGSTLGGHVVEPTPVQTLDVRLVRAVIGDAPPAVGQRTIGGAGE